VEGEGMLGVTMMALVQVGSGLFALFAACFWFAASIVPVPINLRADVNTGGFAHVEGLEEMQSGFAWQSRLNAFAALNAAVAAILQVIGMLLD
jgi:hypothetical protein